MTDDWVKQLQQLNGRLESLEANLGTRAERRAILQQTGPIRTMRKLTGPELEQVLRGRPMVGVDGTINTFGGQFPYYLDMLRALAKPTQGEPVVLKAIHCPLPPEDAADEEAQLRSDNELRQRKLADLEVQAALMAIDRDKPHLILMDGPLVRFDMRTKESFLILRDKVVREKIVLLGCIENIESRVLRTVLGERVPPAWRNRFDRDLLWDALDYGEVLAIREPAKGLPRQEQAKDAGEVVPICTCFMRSALDPGVVGVDMLAEQAAMAEPFMDYLFTLSPADGRGIPIWLDVVDREVRLTDVELEAYLELLDPRVKREFLSKRDARFY
jgi:hypothetical protein